MARSSANHDTDCLEDEQTKEQLRSIREVLEERTTHSLSIGGGVAMTAAPLAAVAVGSTSGFALIVAGAGAIGTAGAYGLSKYREYQKKEQLRAALNEELEKLREEQKEIFKNI